MPNKRVRYYPYPMLAYDKKDYRSGHFKLSLTWDRDNKCIHYYCSIDIESEMFVDYIKRGDVEIYVRIECPVTKFRIVEQIPYDNLDNYHISVRNYPISVRLDSLSKNVEITALLVAKRPISFCAADADLDSFYVPDPNAPDQIEYPQSSIVGYSQTYTCFVEKPLTSNGQMSSVITFVPIIDESVTTMSSDSSGDKLIIKLPRKTYESCHDMKGIMIKTRLAAYVLPVLVDLIHKLRDPEFYEECEDTFWFRSTAETLEKTGISLSDIKSDDNDIEPLEIAQRILGGDIICKVREELMPQDDEEVDNAN